MMRRRLVIAGVVVSGLVISWLVWMILLGESWNKLAWCQVRASPPGTRVADQRGTGAGIGERVRLPRDRNAERKLEEAQRLIKDQQWRQAIDLLQAMLDDKEDKFLQDARGRWASVRSEANRLIASMGAEGLQHYEQYYGAQARAALQAALRAGDPQKIAEVAMRYLHTEAGADALAALGTIQLDQGSPVMAALYFERLLARPGGWDRLPTLTLVKAAFALERAGHTALCEKLWRELQRRDWHRDLPEPLARLDRQQLQQLARSVAVGRVQRERFDWPMFGGDVQRSAISEGTAPFLEKIYEWPTYKEAAARSEIENAIRSLQSRRMPVLAGGLPISIGELLICRTTFGIQAVQIRTGEIQWTSSSEDNLDTILVTRRTQDYAFLLNQYRTSAPGMLVHNTLLGTLSADHERVYAVEDTPLPPIVPRRQPNVLPPGGTVFAVGNWSLGNNLSAFDLRGGRCVWMIEGGKSNADSPLAETFFLGPPLPLGGKLYVLAESNGEIRLVCLEPQTGAVQWVQPLCYVERRIQEDPERRVDACQPAYSDGILVCPTNAGVVLGVDLLTRALVWARPYEGADTELGVSSGKRIIVAPGGYRYGPLTERRWYYAAPMIADGKVVFTAPDSDAIYCVHLQDGSLAWNPLLREQNDLYVAGIYHGRIIIVSRDSVRAVRLNDGELVWRTALPPTAESPSGRGVANATTYFLPTHKGAVVALSLQDGAILGTIESPSKEPIGNLLFHNGYVAAQGLTSLVVYPQLEVRKTEIAKALEKNPNDPEALTELGTLRIHWGELDQACADLRRALQQPDVPYATRRRAQQKLFEALSIQLQRDFASYEKYLPEFEQLLTIAPAPDESESARVARQLEERQRRAQYWHLLARGRENQGRFREAFLAYLEFAKLGSKEYVTLPQDGSIRVIPELYAEAKLTALLHRALTPEQRQELESLIRQEWERVRASPNRESLRQFVSLFGMASDLGAEARLLLAEQYLAAGENIEAEMVLLPLQSQEKPQWAAAGLEALARLHARFGRMQDAIFYYRKLAERYPDVRLPKGKSGRQLLDELATDKRFFPYLDSVQSTWLPTRSEITPPRIEAGTFPAQMQVWLTVEGELVPPSRRYSLAVNVNNHPQQLRIYTRGAGSEDAAEVRTLPLEPPPVANVLGNLNLISGHWPEFRCQVVGHLAFFVWGTHLYALDLERQVFAWKANLMSETSPWPAGVQPMIFYDPNLGWMINHPDGTRERINGQFLATSGFIAYFSRDRGLVVAEPATGRIHWERRIAVDRAWLFGDEQALFIAYSPPGREDGSEGKGETKPLVLSARTGEPLSVPDFLPAWSRCEKVIGRQLLLREVGEHQQEDWRLYDPLIGKNVWTRRLLNVTGRYSSLAPNTLAVSLLAPKEGDDADSGQLVPHLLVLDAHTGRDLLRAELPGQFPAQSEATILADDYHLYLACKKANRGNAPNLVLPNGRQILGFGLLLRSVPIEGPLVAFDRSTGKVRWQSDLPAQLLILDRFEESPLILCASWQRVPLDDRNRRFIDQMLIHGVDKRNGRVQECETAMRSQFHQVRLDRQRGIVELVAGNFRVVFEVAEPSEPSGAKPGQDREKPAPRPDSQPVPGNVPAQPVRPVVQPVQRIAVPLQPLPVRPVPVPAVPKNPAPQPFVPALPTQPAPAVVPQPLPAQPARPLPDQPAAKPRALPAAEPAPANKGNPRSDVAKPTEPRLRLAPGHVAQEHLQRLEQIRLLQEKLQQQVRHLHNDGPGIDREKFEQLRKTLEELRRLQSEKRAIE